jgi:hypothetical protein
VQGQAAIDAVAWIKDNLRPQDPFDDPPTETGTGVSVASVLPAGFEVYLRLFHRFDDNEGHWTTWSERAEAAGVRYHSQLSERALALVIFNSYALDAPWTTTEGSIDDMSRPALSAVLSQRTGPAPVSMYFGLAEEVKGRDPLIIEQAVSALAQDPVHPVFSDHLVGPELVWPADRSWIVCTDYDLHSTYIACNAALAEALSAHPDLEILPTTLDERVDYRRDLINCGPLGLSVPHLTREQWQRHHDRITRRPDNSPPET